MSDPVWHDLGPIEELERTPKLNELRFRHCEGYHSKSLHACTWPCSITQDGAGFIITGGQDNVQGVAGHLREVEHSAELREGAEALADRAVQLAAEPAAVEFTHEQVARGGRTAHHLA